MIGRLRGTLISKQAPALLLEVNGVGYELEVPMSTFYELPESGQEVALITHYAVKEDGVSLYGFLHEAERMLFRSLLKVSGIGAKTALSVLSGVSVADFVRLVVSGDSGALVRIPGIGKKTAERILLELRDRVEHLADGRQPAAAGHATIGHDPLAEASAALVQFGYKPAEITRLLNAAAEPGDSAETLIRKALKAALR
ncbi:MAG: Holliday junction branch migration protein RuvA [Lysobacterales bacterium]